MADVSTRVEFATKITTVETTAMNSSQFVQVIITKVESSLMSNLSVDWDIGRNATFLESETTPFVISSFFFFFPFLIPYDQEW